MSISQQGPPSPAFVLLPSRSPIQSQTSPSRHTALLKIRHQHGLSMRLTPDSDNGNKDTPLPVLGDLRPNAPEGLRLEGGDQLVLLHAEVEGGGLAGPVANHRCVQVAVLALSHRSGWCTLVSDTQHAASQLAS